MGCEPSLGRGCVEWSWAAARWRRVTAWVACSGTRLGSVRMDVDVLRSRSELRTTEEERRESREREVNTGRER